MIYTVKVSKNAKKDLKRVPTFIVTKLQTWIAMVTTVGIREARKVKSFHDESLKGQRKGQRSIRLNKAYRAIYTEYENGSIEFDYIEIDEVNKHGY